MSTTRQRRGLAAVIVPAALALLVLGAVALAGCGSSSSSGGGASPAASVSSGPITVTDGSGASVTLQQPAARIVSLAPANTEIAYAVGAGDKMVAGAHRVRDLRVGRREAHDARRRLLQRDARAGAVGDGDGTG